MFAIVITAAFDTETRNETNLKHLRLETNGTMMKMDVYDLEGNPKEGGQKNTPNTI